MSREVLVVDNSEESARQLKHMLESLGWRVHTASNGAEGIDVFWAHRGVTLVVSHVELPIIDGFEMIRRLKRLGFRGGFVIVTDSNEDPSAHTNGERILGWFRTPFHLDTLRQVLATSSGK